ncbi:major facilitator superfamily domain-containing protein [Microdochium bolleyi]|uniref:Major facilitator superfamily domain-containing protein n=1 Tax=Microdochium bolleyi TaxID=196109 RepID=A0A136IK54_9PEZI|nr:major facilitator superfamily domain-containing protein [Microdochium bolleyi]
MSSEHSHHHAGGGVAIAVSDKHHGIALWPTPSSDPRDPLRWRRRVKIAAMLAVSLSNFVANFAGAGFSVATPVLQAQFQKTPSEVNALLTFNFLLLGLGNLFWVPLSLKVGKRFVMLSSMALLFSALIWTAKATTFNSLLAARCVTGFASSAGESIVPGVVSDIFFLHERATMMAVYVVLTSGATAVGPLVAAFMVGYLPGTWVDFSWLCMALALFCFICMFFFYPESNFDRPSETEDQATRSHAAPHGEAVKDEATSTHQEAGDKHPTEQGVQHLDHVDIDWPSVWTSVIRYDSSLKLSVAILRPIAFVALPPVLWAILIYGSALAAQVILLFAFPSLLMAPPYFFNSDGIGLIQIAALVGFIAACFSGGLISDIIVTRLIRRNKNEFFPEQRLVSLVPAFWIGPLGCIIAAVVCSQKLSWVGIAFAFAMLSYGTVFSPNIAITYVADSFPLYSSECLVAINACKNLVAFLFLYVSTDWVHSQGWVQVYMIMFMVTVVAPLLAAPLYYFRHSLAGFSHRVVARINRLG